MYHYIKDPVAVMHAAPQTQSKVVSQGLFSEPIHILEQSGEWKKIEIAVDSYQGWIKASSICSRKDRFLSSPDSISIMVNRCAAHLYEKEDVAYSPILTLPYESRLEFIASSSASRWIKVGLPTGKCQFIQRGDVIFNPNPISQIEMCNLSRQFLGLPYTWGGRSSFGYDCSGFIQMLYRRKKIYLPRDSKDQFLFDKLREIEINELNLGDLIFFGHSKEKICHVGLYLGCGEFIHTSAVSENAPYLRVSCLADEAWNGNGYYSYLSARTLVVDDP